MSCPVPPFLPPPATEHDRSRYSQLTLVNDVNDGAILLIRGCRLRPRFSPVPRGSFGWLVTRPTNAGFGGLPFACSDLRDRRARGSRIKDGDISAPTGKLAARISVFGTTGDHRPDHGTSLAATDTAFTSVFAVPSVGRQGYAEVSTSPISAAN